MSIKHRIGFKETLRKLYTYTKDIYYLSVMETLDYISYDSVRNMCNKRGMIYAQALNGKVIYTNI